MTHIHSATFEYFTKIDGSSPEITIISKLSKLKLFFVVRFLNKKRSLELTLLPEMVLKDWKLTHTEKKDH